jgi:nucleoside-diphosphate-sugar epimerase
VSSETDRTPSIPDPRVIDWCRDARVAVIGGFGLLGSALVPRLLSGGCRSVVVVEPATASPSPLAAGVERRVGDIRDAALLTKALSGCSAVFHLAALKSAPGSADAPLDYFQINMMGTVNVLEACRRESVRSIVYASTSHVYGSPTQIPVPEEHPTRPLSIYAASKLAGETIALAYASSYGTDARVVRMANLYGGRADDSTIAGRAITQAAAGQPLRLRSLEAVRDFLHVADAAEGLIRIVAAPPAPGGMVVNLSDAQPVSTGRLAELTADAATALGLPRPEIIRPEKTVPEAVPSLVLSNQRLRSVTGWVPGISLADGLKALLNSTLEEKRAKG